MTLNKVRQVCRPVARYMYLNQNSRGAQNSFFCHSYRKATSNGVSCTHGSRSFSSSAFLNTENMDKGDEKQLNVNYKDIVDMQNDSCILIIDVREQSEIDETGNLPGSIHIPMGEVANVLVTLSDEDFKKKFCKSKPTKDTKIILSCRSGRRSAMVQKEIQKMGYENAYNYEGGWLDWEYNQNV